MDPIMMMQILSKYYGLVISNLVWIFGAKKISKELLIHSFREEPFSGLLEML
jgi:hypothetical protein